MAEKQVLPFGTNVFFTSITGIDGYGIVTGHVFREDGSILYTVEGVGQNLKELFFVDENHIGDDDAK